MATKVKARNTHPSGNLGTAGLKFDMFYLIWITTDFALVL